MKRFFILTIAVMCALGIQAQVGIGTTTPNKAAKLHVSSESMGVLIPSISNFSEINNKIDSLSDTDKADAVGMMVFYKTDSLFYTWDGAKWQCMNPIQTDATSGTIAPKEPYNKFTGHYEGTATLEGNFTGGPGSEFNGYGSVPIGGIIMWSGLNPPDNWKICNGSTHNVYDDNSNFLYSIRTPNLSNRFVLGSYPASGGSPGNLSEKGTNNPENGGATNFTIDVNNLPSHDHDIDIATQDAGRHKHGVRVHEDNEGTGTHYLAGSAKGPSDADGYIETYNGTTKTMNTYYYNFGGGTGSPTNVSDVNGIVGHHKHRVLGTTENTGNGDAISYTPRYYALAFIMRIK